MDLFVKNCTIEYFKFKCSKLKNHCHSERSYSQMTLGTSVFVLVELTALMHTTTIVMITRLLYCKCVIFTHVLQLTK